MLFGISPCVYRTLPHGLITNFRVERLSGSDGLIIADFAGLNRACAVKDKEFSVLP